MPPNMDGRLLPTPCLRTPRNTLRSRRRFCFSISSEKSASSGLDSCSYVGMFWFRLSRSEEHTSELQSRENLVCRLLLEKKKEKRNNQVIIMSEIICAKLIL